MNSNKIKLEIECTGQQVEMANFLLGRAYENAKDNDKVLKIWNISGKELRQAEIFRKKLLKAYFTI